MTPYAIVFQFDTHVKRYFGAWIALTTFPVRQVGAGLWFAIGTENLYPSLNIPIKSLVKSPIYNSPIYFLNLNIMLLTPANTLRDQHTSYSIENVKRKV